MRFFLSGYTIRVTKRGNCKKNLRLDKIPGQQNFLNIFFDYLKTLSSKALIDENIKSMMALQDSSLNLDKKKR